eukprot:TRINITY_DN17786_c0_g1_i1.p1 TRINITY_DN17786_c0_g1~~TRINITY_DN17786_c0_g1_i1.p1  ORF type:complete len:316 (-),score=103.03 TRINITY_DN17786_c0_g1_i1:96-971(-)
MEAVTTATGARGRGRGRKRKAAPDAGALAAAAAASAAQPGSPQPAASPAPAESGGGTNKGDLRQLHEVIEFLKASAVGSDSVDGGANGVSLHDVLVGTGINLLNFPELLQTLKTHSKVTYNETSGLYAYKPTYDIHNRDDLERLLERTPDGISEEDLKDSYKGAADDIKATVEAGTVIGIENTETKSTILFPNDTSFIIRVTPDVQRLWNSIVVPDEVELERTLEELGIGSSDKPKLGARKRATSVKARRGGKIRKLTNTHLVPGLDMNKAVDEAIQKAREVEASKARASS